MNLAYSRRKERIPVGLYSADGLGSYAVLTCSGCPTRYHGRFIRNPLQSIPMKRAILAPSLLIGLLLGASSCANLKSADASAPNDQPKAADSGDEIADAQAALDSATVRLEIAKMESVSFDAKHAAKLENALVELDLAKQALVQFDSFSKPTRMSQENLNLKSTKESAAEAQEELEQIELMYKDQDLNDMTREFVVARGKRRAISAQARIDIREANVASILEHDLPMQRQRFTLGIKRAEQGLAALALDGEIGRRGKELSVTEATRKVGKATQALAKLAEGASS